MSYWKKKNNCKKIRCLGKLSESSTEESSRCRNEFYPNGETITCHIHRDQKDATYWYESKIGQFKDVAIIIARYIDIPNTFFVFSQICRSTAKACHELQKEKMDLWKRKSWYRPYGDLNKRYILPSGSVIDENYKFLKRGK